MRDRRQLRTTFNGGTVTLEYEVDWAALSPTDAEFVRDLWDLLNNVDTSVQQTLDGATPLEEPPVVVSATCGRGKRELRPLAASGRVGEAEADRIDAGTGRQQ